MREFLCSWCFLLRTCVSTRDSQEALIKSCWRHTSFSSTGENRRKFCAARSHPMWWPHSLHAFLGSTLVLWIPDHLVRTHLDSSSAGLDWLGTLTSKSGRRAFLLVRIFSWEGCYIGHFVTTTSRNCLWLLHCLWMTLPSSLCSLGAIG